MTERPSVPREPLVSDARAREALRRELDRAINVEHTLTRAQLASESGVNIHTVDQLLSRDPGKQRRVCLADALSLASVLGERTVSALIAPIGYAAHRPDEAPDDAPMLIAAHGMAQLATIAAAAADGRIDHTERPGVEEAADLLIATVLPLSSAGQKA